MSRVVRQSGTVKTEQDNEKAASSRDDSQKIPQAEHPREAGTGFAGLALRREFDQVKQERLLRS